MENNKWLVTDTGIQLVTPQSPEWEDPDAPIFDTRDEAMIYMLTCLANRIEDLEKKAGKK